MEQTPNDLTAARMQALVEQWQAAETRSEDRRVIFLRCYLLMTDNMLAAIERQEFHDPAWVNNLLHRFAGYYFTALDAYEAGISGQNPSVPAVLSTAVRLSASSSASGDLYRTPPVWQLAFHAARQEHLTALQHLLLGVNAHINYDLILALVDLLEPEWDTLTEDQRSLRYQDHCLVNRVIGETVDAVQDQVLDPEMPLMAIIDRIMGRTDEALISHLLAHWRDIVWNHANRLLEISDPDERRKLIQHYEKEVLELGEILQLREFRAR